MDKPREIENKVGRIRPVGRETYDMRAATAIPSATGGRPPTSGPAGRIAAVEGVSLEPKLIPLGTVAGGLPAGLRYAKPSSAFLPTVEIPNRTLEEYTINNQDMVNITASYLEKVSMSNPGILEGFDSPYEAAQWSVAQIQRSFEPGSQARMLDIIHQSRAGREVYQYLRQIEEAQNVES